MTAIYAAMELKKRGYYTVIAAPYVDARLLREMTEAGLDIIVMYSLPYLGSAEYKEIEKFDIILVNCFANIRCAVEISDFRPVLWWQHEAYWMYEDPIRKYGNYIENVKKNANVEIEAVSNITLNNFSQYIPNKITQIMPYGIPDLAFEPIEEVVKEKRITFAIIGGVCECKAQLDYVRAVLRLPEEIRTKAKFLLIGGIGRDKYSNDVRELSNSCEEVLILGQLTREEINKIYREIDVVVCPSIQDPLPIVVTEGLMYRKICIVSYGVGQSEWIINGTNGFLVHSGNIRELSDVFIHIINNFENVKKIGVKGRRVYDAHFSMHAFGERLEKALIKAEEKWYGNMPERRRRD